ncbi:MAG: S9 family peptidase [Balneolaceae bacterium]
MILKRILFPPVLLLTFFLLTDSIYSQETQPYSYMDVFDTQYISDPRISPNGSKIVYVRNSFDIFTDRRRTHLWIINQDGSGHRALTSGKEGAYQPRWSPDGERLAYVSGEEGSSQIFVRWMENGTSASITNLTKSPGNLSWSPDGKWIAFSMSVPAEKPSLGNYPAPPDGAEWAPEPVIIDSDQYRSDGQAGFVGPAYTHLFIVSSEGGAPRQITRGNYNHGAPRWTPDGESLIFSANRNEKAAMDPGNTHIFEAKIHSLEIQKLTEGRGPHSSPTVSPDGKRIVFTGYDDQFVGYQLTLLYIMDRDGSNVREIDTQLDRDVENVQWLANSRELFFQFNNEGVGTIARTNLEGEVTILAVHLGGTTFGRPYSGGSYSLANNGRFAFPLTRPYHPADLAVGDRARPMQTTRLTSLNEILLSGRKLGEVSQVEYSSSFDGKKIQGWVVTPPDFNPEQQYPLILEIHGGPYLDYGPRFSPEIQLKASNGYVVLYTNPRGSTSYGEEFASYINHNYPSEDYDDLMSGVDYMLEQGYINEDQLFITGGSGGGVLTSWSIGKTDRFAAAVVSKPVINWFSFSLTADMYIYSTKYWFTEMPWQDPQQYLERSPISLVGNVTTPTLLLTGEEDYRTPMSETEQYYNALRLQGVESMMIRVPESSHSIASRPSNLIRKVAYIVGWFDQHLSVNSD